MIEVKKPILLDDSLNDGEVLQPISGNLNIRMVGVSECTLVLQADSPAPSMHQWVKLFNQNGFAGIYRMTSSNRDIPDKKDCLLRHGIDIIQDSYWAEETDFTGTVGQFITAVLDKQTQLIGGVKPWVLGTCEDTSTIVKKIDYDNLKDLLDILEDEGGDYYYTYDQTQFPWVLNYVAKTSAVASEFRLNRNMDTCRISVNDSELCTRLILDVNAMTEDQSLGVEQNMSVKRVYNNTTAQATYGIIVKKEDIDTEDTLPNGPFTEADAFAAKYLDQRKEPTVSVSIDGYELKAITGDSWDESRIGTVCRAAIPDYDTFIAERLVSVNYPDIYGFPDKVTVTLSNASASNLRRNDTLSEVLDKQDQEIRRVGGGGRGQAREAESFQQHFQIVDDDANILEQAGLYLDAHGMLVYADDNVNMIGSRFNVQADQIGMVVGTNQQGNYIKAGEITLAINETTGQSIAIINADHVNVSGTSTVQLLSGAMERDSNGDLIIKDGVGLKMRRTVSGQTAEFGVYNENNLTGGIVVGKINGQTGTFVKISANTIDIDGLINALKTKVVYAKDVIATGDVQTVTVSATGLISTSGNMDCTNLSASKVTTGDLTFDGDAVSWKSYSARHVSLSNKYYFVDYLGTQVQGRIVTGYTDTTLNYMGK